MAHLSQLLSRLPGNIDVRMSTMGHVVWVSWHDRLAPAVGQTLLNYGGMLVGEEAEQSIWFFFTDDVFLALARLMVWGNFNELPVAIELFPGRLQFGRKREVNLLLDGALQAQQIVVTDALEIWIHPKSREGKKGLPGITFERRSGRQGMAGVDWASMTVDVRMPYASTQSWFAVLHPLGSPLDKAYQVGWTSMFKRLEVLLQKHKIKSIVDNTFMMIAIDNLQMLRTFMRDYLHSFDKEKNEAAGYWPCVSVVADRNNLNFNADLPKKIGLQWDNLMPDFPYLSYRNAYLLGEGFTVRDLRFTGEQMAMDSWCNVMLDENSLSGRSIALLMPSRLTSPSPSGMGCVYCGIHSHDSSECPTRFGAASNSQEVWENIGQLDLEAINEGFRSIEMTLTEKGAGGYGAVLGGEDDAAVVLRAVLEINSACQLRNVPRHWLYRMREPEPNEAVPSKDDSPAWDLLDKLITTSPSEMSEMEKKISQAISRHQRDPRLHMVQAFAHIERNDYPRAEAAFRNAAVLTPSPALQAWTEFFLARLAEEQGQFSQAIEQYSQIWRVMPQWREVKYREIVCQVKMGFCEPVLDQLITLIREEPAYFNRALIDPALERGRLLILSALYDLWTEAKKCADADRVRVNEISGRINAWFAPEHPVQLQLGEKVRELETLANINNYLAYLKVVAERPNLEREMEDCIAREVEDLRNRYKYYLDILQEIRDEASWFPFPAALREFSQEFNESAGIINRAFSCNFKEAEAFKRAQGETPHLAELLRSLRKRLQFLRMVRDGTLFGLTLLKTFMWMEALGLLLCFVAVPVVYFWGDTLRLGWLRDILGSEPWSIQKILILIVTMVSLGTAALRTTLVFDRKRERLLEEARQQREQAQQTRLERVRQQRRLEAERAQKKKDAEQAGKK
ncbi:tetratricopeptide repeat protein [Desulfovibrio desulfuricans]|uniref:tetratricopeptide repeat protein n=1 Tax=Desulfovibrio desulfuricans TaxID=876 RepID=UPI0003B4D29B|nr:tetratricopeptide repeat protein [Desulfovibrio desulfuricans]MDD3682844.1 tetratricopeptide repeat protein [Desulfovibrio desulfuricans]QTO40980.1 tetratricopeptide repeat protein [Desulfovibrio desulfuricans]